MALWDVLSGQVYRWNSMKAEALDRVCKGLKPFVSSRLAQYPDSAEWFTQARNNLFAFYLSTSQAIGQLLDTDFARFTERFYSFRPDDYLRFISAFHMRSIIATYSQREKPWYDLMTDGIVEMYGKKPAYLDGWHNYAEWYRNELPTREGAALRLASRLYAEIAPLLGLAQSLPAPLGPGADIHAEMYFYTLGHEFAMRADRVFKQPTWAQAVEGELAGH